MFAMFVNSDRWTIHVWYVRSMSTCRDVLEWSSQWYGSHSRCFRVLLSTKESDVYPAAARELKAELLNTLPGNLVNSKLKFQWISLCKWPVLIRSLGLMSDFPFSPPCAGSPCWRLGSNRWILKLSGPGGRWPVTRSCSKILFYSPNGAFWQGGELIHMFDIVWLLDGYFCAH